MLLSIAGFDPSGGAGVLLDLQVFRYFDFTGSGILTALTAQNTYKVERVFCPPPEILAQQYNTLEKDIPLFGIKIGMIGTRKNLPVLKRIVQKNRKIPIVIDPVLKSGSGAWLLEHNAVQDLIQTFMGIGSLITPNLDEVFLLSGFKVKGPDDLEKAAHKIYDIFKIPCLIKGGHFKGSKTDCLYDGRHFVSFTHKKIPKDVHGTGCFLSSSILCLLARGLPLHDACSQGINLTQEAIRHASPRKKGRAIITVPRSVFQPHKP